MPSKDLLEAMTQEHPLQPFSARYFHQGDALFSYASEWQVLHQDGGHAPGHEMLDAHVQEEPLSLGQLQDFLRNPVRHLLQSAIEGVL